MKKQSHLWFYILINILISAAATLTVLVLWNRAHPAPEGQPAAITLPEDNAHSTPVNTAPEDPIPTLTLMTENIDVVIRTVVGAGHLEAEYVEIYNQSEGTVNLTGWQLTGEHGQRFTFPTLILNPGGAVTVHSKSGAQSVIELFWQAETPNWRSGEEVRLSDSAGNPITTYTIP